MVLVRIGVGTDSPIHIPLFMLDDIVLNGGTHRITRLIFIGNQPRTPRYHVSTDEIYVIGADRQGLKRATHDIDPKNRPSFSPDGLRIAYYAWHEGEGFDHIYVVDTDGRNRKRLTHNQEHHSQPAWSPDGQTIAYVMSNDIFFGGATIHLMTGDGEYLKQLSDVHDAHDYQPDFRPIGLDVSPTSNKITIWGGLKKLALNFR